MYIYTEGKNTGEEGKELIDGARCPRKQTERNRVKNIGD